MAESFVEVNIATTPGKKMATFEFVNGAAEVVESEAVTLTDSAGNELLGPQLAAASIPVVLATDEIVNVALAAAVTGTLTVVPATIVPVLLLAADPTRVGFSIYNQSLTDTLYILLTTVGGPVSDSFFSVALQPNAYFEDPFRYTGDINGVWSGATPGSRALVNDYKP